MISHIGKTAGKIKVIPVILFLIFACAEKEASVTDDVVIDSTLDQDLTTAVNKKFPDQWPPTFGFGKRASDDDISRWNIDIMPDGTGLPSGSGSVSEGAIIYQHKCAVCHGINGTEGPYDKLVGREPRADFPFGKDAKYASMKTIGNYWPYATTLFDYLRRAMPQNEPGSLTANEVYALSAYLLHLNEVIPTDARLDSVSLPLVKMPAHDRFVVDNRRGGKEIH
jgi:cytochrome c